MEPWGVSMIANSTTSDQPLTLWVGCPRSAHDWNTAAPLLVVEADAEKAEEFRLQLTPDQDVIVRVEVLAATSGESVLWHHYNDSRLNGPHDISYWQDHYPNLCQTSSESRRSCCLADLISSWMASRQAQSEPALRLRLNQGNPIPTLEGLGDWLPRLESVQLNLPGAKERWIPELDAWLTERCFTRETERPGTWQRDPLATALLLLRQQEQQISSLSHSQTELIAQRAEAQALQAELLAQRTAAQTLETELISQRQTAQTLDAELTAQRAEAQALQAELLAQGDGLGARVEQLQGGMDWLLGQISELNAHVDQAVAHDPTVMPEIPVPAAPSAAS